MMCAAFACGDVDSGDGDGDGDSDPCVTGCELTITAACSMGPADQAACETDCQSLREGTCGTEYEALLTCGDGEAVTCDAVGFPTVEACPSEETAFRDCLNN